MAVVENVQRKSARKPAKPKSVAHRGAGRQAASKALDAVAEIRELAWTGQHARAIDQCTRALATTPGGKPLALDSQLDLLDLRAESYVALGKLDAEHSFAFSSECSSNFLSISRPDLHTPAAIRIGFAGRRNQLAIGRKRSRIN